MPSLVAPQDQVSPINQWHVHAYRGKNRDVNLGETWVRASTFTEACDLGRRALKITGHVRGSFQVYASPYKPWLDYAFTGYIARSKTDGQ